MPQFALSGTYLLPGMPGAQLSTGPVLGHQIATRWFDSGQFDLTEDIETYGVGADAGPGRIKLVTFATGREAVMLNPRANDGSRELIAWVQYYARSLTMHNANFDCPSLAINQLFPIECVNKVWDTIIDARLATPGLTPKTLEACLERYLEMQSEPILNLFRSLGYKTKKEGFLHLDIDSTAYLFGAASDAIGTARLAPVIAAAAIDRQLDHPFRSPIGLSRWEAEQMRAERHEHNRWGIESTIRGLPVDFDYLDRYRADNAVSMDQAQNWLASINITNGNQLVRFLEQTGALPPDHPRTPKEKKPSTKAEDLERLHHPVAEVHGKLVKQQKLDGYLQKCVDMADANGRIHPTTATLKAAHGRDAMADPPLHQFPGLARPIIRFDEDGTSTDWSQQEPRLGMNLAGDIGPPLLAYERMGTKIYTGIAEYADIDMPTAKIVVLAGLYGEGTAKLSADLGLSPDPWIPEETWTNGRVIKARWGYEAAKDIQRAVFSAIPLTEQFMNNGKRIARDHALAYTMAGRIVPIPSGFYEGKYSVQAHKWINYCVSGSANDEISRTIVTARRMGMGHLVWFGMHDELIHATSIAREIRQLMEQPSERFCRLAGRVPVIRTDQERLGMSWRKV